MRILIVNTLYYPKLKGGAEVSVQLLAEGLAAAGHEVFVLTSGLKSQVRGLNRVRVIRIRQGNIYSSYEDKERRAWQKVLWHLIDSWNPFNYFRMRKLLNRIRPEIVHTNNIQGFSPMIWKAVKKQRIPLVHTLRDYYLLCHRTNLYKGSCKCDRLCGACRITHTIKRGFTGCPDRYVGISDFIVRKHEQYFEIPEKKIKVIYNPVKKPETPAAIKLPGEKLVLGYMGRIAQDKGAGYLASELIKLRQDLRPRFKVIFAGKGDRDYVMELQRQLDGIEYEFPGMMKPEGFYEKVDLAIMPSLWDEPFGRIVIESLSHSVPVILAESGGLLELHNPDCTWSFVPKENKLHPLIEHIMENKQELVLKKKYCREYAGLFSEDINVRQYVELYRELLGRALVGVPFPG